MTGSQGNHVLALGGRNHLNRPNRTGAHLRPRNATVFGLRQRIRLDLPFHNYCCKWFLDKRSGGVGPDL